MRTRPLGPFGVEQGEGRRAERDVVLNGLGKGNLAEARLEGRVADFEARRRRPARNAAETVADVPDEFQQFGAHDVATGLVRLEGVLARDGLLFARFPVDGCRCASVREVDQLLRDEGVWLHPLEVAAGEDAVGLEGLDRLSSDSPEYADGTRREERREFRWAGRQDCEAVRLVLLGADFREQAIGGDADGAGHAAGGANLRAEGFAEAARVVSVEVERAAHVEERLVDADGLDVGRVVGEDVECACGDGAVEIHVRRREDGLRTLRVGRPRGHGGANAEGAGFVGAGRDDAAFVGSCADDERLPAPLRVVQKFDRREKGVHIDMEDCRHGG